MLLWGIFGHWQNIRRIRKAKRRLAAGQAWWGQSHMARAQPVACTLHKKRKLSGGRINEDLPFFFNSFTGTFYCR